MSGRGNMRTRAARTVTRLRSRGAAEVLGWFLGVIRTALWSTTEIIFLVRPVPGRAVPLRQDATCRPVLEDDAVTYAADIGTDSASTFRTRLRANQQCYLVEEGTRFLHSTWLTRAPVWMAETHRFVGPPSGSVYVFESYTRPEARGRGLFAFALGTISGDFRDEDVWIAVSADNIPSLRAVEKAGFRSEFTIRVRRRLGGVWLHLPEEGWLLFGSSAEDARGP
ncbi:MAG: GNAT family N-acetyltransferase [Actinomycetota bacterium]